MALRCACVFQCFYLFESQFEFETFRTRPYLWCQVVLTRLLCFKEPEGQGFVFRLTVVWFIAPFNYFGALGLFSESVQCRSDRKGSVMRGIMCNRMWGERKTWVFKLSSDVMNLVADRWKYKCEYCSSAMLSYSAAFRFESASWAASTY